MRPFGLILLRHFLNLVVVDLDKGEIICLVGEGPCVRLDVQHFRVVYQGLEDVVAEAIRFEWSDVAGEELLDGF